jgi:hypothetical protein
MTIEIEVSGTGKYKGHKTNIAGYEYVEESTPIIPGDDKGGLGSLSFDVSEDDKQSILLYNDTVQLLDSKYGLVAGFINSLAVDTGLVTATGYGRLGRVNYNGQLVAKNTTLGGLITDLLNESGIIGNINIDSSISSIPVVAPGYSGDLWIFLKNICSAYQIEISLIEDTIFVRPIRQRELIVVNKSGESFRLNDITIAQNIDVNYYNYTYEPFFMAFPKGGWTPDVPVYQVNANEEATIDIQVDAYLTSVEQPTAQDFVPRDYSGPSSVYTVSGNDNLPIPAALWTARGGKIELELDSNGRTIVAKVTGANLPNLSPFTIGVSDGSTTYSTLRIMGTGVAFDQQTVRVPTGLTPADTPNELAATIDNPLISTYEQAYTAGVRARLLYALPERIYEASGETFYDPDQSEVDIFRTFNQYDDVVGVGYTFDDFDAQNAGLSFSEFDDFNTRSTSQSFGSVAGSRVRYREAKYRTRTASTADTGMNVTADFDTIFQDFNEDNTGRNFRDMHSAFFGLTFNDFALVPLRIKSAYPFFTLDDEVLGILDENVLAY